MKNFFTILLIGMTLSRAAANEYANCFIPGEVAEYKVSWAGIPLAWSKISTESITENGRELILIRAVSKTYKTYSHIYKVNDLTEVIIDPETALPIRLDLTLNEGTIHKSHLTTFYHDQGVAIFQDRISKDIKEVPIDSQTQELFSFIYSMRNKDIAAVVAKKYQLYSEGKIYTLDLVIHEEDSIQLPDYGNVPSIEIEPVTEFDGIFLRKGKITFWVSKQNRRMVTCIKAKVAVGKISVKLEKVSGPVDDLWTQDK